MTEDAHFRLRLPSDMHAKITEAAQSNRRTLNAEIVARLDQSFALGTLQTETSANLEQLAKNLAEVRVILNYVQTTYGLPGPFPGIGKPIAAEKVETDNETS